MRLMILPFIIAKVYNLLLSSNDSLLIYVNAYILCSDKISVGCLDYNKYYRYKFLSRRTRAVRYY